MKKWQLLVAVLGVFPWAGQSAYAQGAQPAPMSGASQPADSPPPIAEIVVTAQRRSEKLQDVPIAITVLTSKQLETSGITGTTDLGKVTPGFTTLQASGFYTPYIRGVGARSITPGDESNVATYVDGVYQTDKQGLLMSGFSDVDSIQVLRGPQGTLFGRNATGGAVLVTTRAPSDHWTGAFEATGGSDEWGGKAYLSGPLSRTISFSIDGFYRYQTNYIKNLYPENGGGDKIGKAKAYGVRGKIKWEPTSDFTATLEGDYANALDEAPWAVQAIAGTGPTLGEAVAAGYGIAIPDIRSSRPVYGGQLVPNIHDKGLGESLTLLWKQPTFTIKSVTAHRADISSGLLDLSGTPLPLFYFQTHLRSNVWQEEMTIASNTNSRLNWQGGVFLMNYRDGYTDLDQNTALLYPWTPAAVAATPGSAHTDQFSYVTIRTLGVFGEVGYKITDKDTLTLGLRYTAEKQSLDPNSYSTTLTPNGMGGIDSTTTTYVGLCAETPSCDGLSTTFHRVTWRAVYEHQFTRDIMAYASYNRGFKSGVYNISAFVPANLTATKPEVVDAFEAGFKSQLFDRKLTLNLSAYYNNYKDMQVPVTLPINNTQVSINAAQARIAGLEAEAVIHATRDLTFSLGASEFLQRHYVSFPGCTVYVATAAGNAVATPAPDCSGTRLPSTPDTVDIQADYRVPLHNGQSLSFNGLLSWSEAFDFAPYANAATRAPQQPQIWTLNASATWRSADQRVHLSVWGRNLANQHNFVGIFTTAFGYMTTYSRGLTWGGTFGYDF